MFHDCYNFQKKSSNFMNYFRNKPCLSQELSMSLFNKFVSLQCMQDRHQSGNSIVETLILSVSYCYYYYHYYQNGSRATLIH